MLRFVPSAAIFWIVGILPVTLHAAKSDAPKSPMVEVSPGVFRFGVVDLDKKARTVTFPAVLNMTRGVIEYLIVGGEGKTHESLLRTDAEPLQIHLAMLLLGSKTAARKAKPDAKADAEKPPDAIDAEYLKHAPKLMGDDIWIELSYEREGKTVRRPAEGLVINLSTDRPMTTGKWLYTGSGFYGGKFCAQDQKSIAAVIDDPCALINNPRKGNDNDDEWAVREKEAPPEGTPVTVTIRLASETKSSK